MWLGRQDRREDTSPRPFSTALKGERVWSSNPAQTRELGNIEQKEPRKLARKDPGLAREAHQEVALELCLTNCFGYKTTTFWNSTNGMGNVEDPAAMNDKKLGCSLRGNRPSVSPLL